MKKTVIVLVAVLAAAAVATAEVSPTETQLVRKQLKEQLKDGAAKAAATKAQVGLVDASGLEYFVNTSITFTTSESASGSAQEASYTTSVAATTSMGGTTMTILSDAFDGYNGVIVNGTVYNDNGSASLDGSCGSRQLIFADQVIGNLTVSRRVFVPDDDEFIRFLTFVTNNGGSTETVTFETANNVGSDSDTVITGSSSGDNLGTVADTWISTFEDWSGGTSSDPRLGHVLRGATDTSITTVSDFGTNNPYFAYSFDVPPGETRIIMNFVTGQPSIADSQAQAAELAALSRPAALRCMSALDLSNLVNFEAGEGQGSAAIPTLDIAGMAILVVLLGLGALIIIRRQA